MRRHNKQLLSTALAASLWSGAAFSADDDLDFLFDDEADETSEVQVEEPSGDAADQPSTSPRAAGAPPQSESAEPEVASNEPTSDDSAAEAESEPAPSDGDEKRLVLEEIVVTAQKRAQSLADVPVSVTAVSGEKLNDAGIENLTDMSEYTPNFKLVDSGLIPNIYMRGVGSGSNQGFELSVGMFADGIHLGRPHQTRAAFMDVQRVEVLRGPQSILFGKNAIAGALNIVSATPPRAKKWKLYSADR